MWTGEKKRNTFKVSLKNTEGLIIIITISEMTPVREEQRAGMWRK